MSWRKHHEHKECAQLSLGCIPEAVGRTDVIIDRGPIDEKMVSIRECDRLRKCIENTGVNQHLRK